VPYCLKPARPIASDIRRIVDKQLALAIQNLRTIGDRRSDEAIHEARRHVKKVRAVLRLVQPTLGDAYAPANARMRVANRMLAPIADGEAVVHTIARLRKRYGRQLSRRTLDSIHTALVERSARIDRKAGLDRVLPKVAAVLRAERGRLTRWTLTRHGFHAVAPGLEKGLRRARKAMARTAAEPTADHYHTWRRRVKDLWFQVRLVEARCGNKLLADERRLEALDGCLGEYHNVVLLEQILIEEALVSREQTVRCLHLLRRYQSALRRRAAVLGRRLFAEKPRRVMRRVDRLWHAATPIRRAAVKKGPWRRAA
jgi:CHAD domain-containing protein